MDPLASDVSSLKGRFGSPLAVGVDCGRNLVSSLLFPVVLGWVPITVVMFLRGDLTNMYTSNAYVLSLRPALRYCNNDVLCNTRYCVIVTTIIVLL